MNRTVISSMLAGCMFSLTASSEPLAYDQFLASQKSCSADVWNQTKWVSTLVGDPMTKLNAKESWPILNEVSVTAGKLTVDKKKGYEERPFQVKYSWFGVFQCGASSGFDRKPHKKNWTVLSTIRNANGENAFLAKDAALLMTSTEGESAEDGWKCYSGFQDFLRNPGVVDVEKLCEGEPEAKKDEARAEIARIAEMLRSQRYAQCKKNKPHLAAVPAGGKAWIDGPANVRAKNSSTSAIVMDLADDAQVDVVQQKGSWFLIKSGGKQGWTAKQNLLPLSIRTECRDWELPQ